LRKYAGEQGEEPLGLESTPERHVERMVEVFREVKRVLRDDGVVWLNYGDCYYNHRPGGSGLTKQTLAKNDREQPVEYSARRDNKQDIGSGSLMMMPHRVALALQADGWIVRQDLVWYKRNPMPESVNGWRWQRERTSSKPVRGRSDGKIASNTDRNDADGGRFGNAPWNEYEYGDDLELKRGSWRHTRAHEYVFMLTKQMQYWSNQEAVREGSQVYTRKAGGYSGHERVDGSQPYEGPGGFKDSDVTTVGRNPRSVLDVPTSPYKGAHYATFPPNLIAPLIRATCPRWACPVCGQGWAAVVEKAGGVLGKSWHDHKNDDVDGNSRIDYGSLATSGTEPYKTTVTAYRPTCSHEHTQEEAVPGIVFDPFLGSGTSVAVAQSLLRRGIGIDLSMDYLDLQAKIRTGQGSPSNQFENLPLFD